MRRVAIALVLLVVLVLFPSPAQADPDGCILNVNGPVVVIVCNGTDIGSLPLPTVTVTAPPVTQPPATVTLPPVTLPPLPAITQIIPGPTKTATVTVPGPTSTTTVEQPGGTETIYLQGPTQTQTVAGPTVTKTANATPALPAPTQTVTSTVTQTVTKEVRVDNHESDNVLFDPPPLTVKSAVGYSALALLVVAGLIVLGLWLGYILGYKDSERKEAKFLSALRDQFYTGKHS